MAETVNGPGVFEPATSPFQDLNVRALNLFPHDAQTFGEKAGNFLSTLFG